MGQHAPRTGGHLATIEVCAARPEDAEAVLSVLRITQTESDNERAIHLYQNLGFTRYARYEGFFKIDGEPIACDLMRLDLA